MTMGTGTSLSKSWNQMTPEEHDGHLQDYHVKVRYNSELSQFEIAFLCDCSLETGSACPAPPLKLAMIICPKKPCPPLF